MKRKDFGVPGLITCLVITVVSKEDKDSVLTKTKPIVPMGMNMVLKPKKKTVPKTNVLVFIAISPYFTFITFHFTKFLTLSL